MSDAWRSARRLPDAPAYWDALAARAVDAALRRAAEEPAYVTPARGVAPAAHTARARGAAPVAWWRASAHAAWPLAATAVFAVLGCALLLAGAPARSAPDDALARALAPDDPLLRSVLDAGARAPAGTLLRLVALRTLE